MPRIRTIKPEFFGSLTIGRLSLRARLTAIGLLPYVDDAGRGLDEPRLIKAAVWPLDDEIRHEDVADDLSELEAVRWLERWTDEETGRPLLRVRSFLEHQRINRPTPSKLPPSPEELGLIEDSMSAHGGLTEDSPPEGKGRERNGGEGKPAASSSAERLVTNKPEEAALVVDELTTTHGVDAVATALDELAGNRYRWASELRTALERELSKRRRSCSTCTGDGWDPEHVDAHGNAIPCPECRRPLETVG